jgi:hypothetical protein
MQSQPRMAKAEDKLAHYLRQAGAGIPQWSDVYEYALPATDRAGRQDSP